MKREREQERVYHQSRTAIESRMVQRVCPVCYVLARIEVAEMSDGWEHWRCTSCGCTKQYKTR